MNLRISHLSCIFPSPVWKSSQFLVHFQLEKEAEAKGIPVCQALDIEIPPPRPKRKPNTPYPRKHGNNGTSSSQVSSAKDAKLASSASSSQFNQSFLDLEKMPFSEVYS